MLDYRVWWRKDFEEVSNALCQYYGLNPNYIYEDFERLCQDDKDCLQEQLWAIREGLA